MKVVGWGVVIIVILCVTVVPTLAQQAPIEREIKQQLTCGHLAGQAYRDCADAVPRTLGDWLHDLLDLGVELM